MKEQMKKIALLSLSLILTSAYSVSIVLPSLLQHFSEYTTAQVEILISAPSFAITAMIVLNAWLSRYMKDRPMIVGGLLLLSVSGMVPVFVQEYPVVLASRIFLGIGIGLINAKAISIFSEYYEGREKAALLGYRGSAEVLGSAVMTLVAGKLVLIRWNLAFWVYALGFVIVLLYLVWVPGSMETGQSAGSQSAGAEKESLEAEADGKRECWKKEVLTIAYAAVCGVCHLHLLFQFPACPDVDFREETWNGVGSQHHSHAHDADGNSCRCLFWKTDDVVEGKIAGAWMPDAWSGDASDRICGQSAADWNWHQYRRIFLYRSGYLFLPPDFRADSAVFYQYSHINRAGRLQSGSGVFAVCAEMDGKIQ